MRGRNVLMLGAVAAALAGAGLFTLFGSNTSDAQAKPPLALAKFGNIFAGGFYDDTNPAKHYVGHLYAEYFIPQDQRHPFPIVMIHGGSQTGSGWIETPDGREGWAPYFLRLGYPVYVVDQVGRGRAPYHDEVYGRRSFQTLEFVSQRFAAGGRYRLWPQAHLHTQWVGTPEPGDTVFDAYWASNIPSMEDRTRQRQLNSDAIVALLDKIGPAILLVHSQSGAFPWTVAQERPALVKAIVALEPSGPPVHDIEFHGAPDWFSDVPALKTYGITDFPVQYEPAVTADSPLEFVQQEQPNSPDLARCWRQKEPARKLVAVGDRPIVLITAEASFYAAYNHCTVEYLQQAGVNADHIRLADVGLKGNGHMMMMERNSDQVAGVVADWLEENLNAAEATAR